MRRVCTEKQSFGKITSGLEKDTVALKTIEFVRRHLPDWRDDPDRPHEDAEERLNLQLCKFLDSRARNDFSMVRFGTEEPQTGRRRADLSASPVETTFIGARPHTIYDPIMVFECKRLPAPSRNREKEYVTGGKERTGGIQRFKLGLHGADLDLAAMIGYLQERSPRGWHSDINRWITELGGRASGDDCAWSDDDKLGALSEDKAQGLASCESVHERTGSKYGGHISIYHLWVVMNGK